jgi:hypothetical protein
MPGVCIFMSVFPGAHLPLLSLRVHAPSSHFSGGLNLRASPAGRYACGSALSRRFPSGASMRPPERL